MARIDQRKYIVVPSNDILSTYELYIKWSES